MFNELAEKRVSSKWKYFHDFTHHLVFDKRMQKVDE